MKGCVAWLAALCGALLLSGCGQGKSGGPAAEPGKDRLKIAGIVFQEDQFFRLVQFGMKDAAAKAGVELLVANSDNKPDKEVQLVNTYIARGVDAVAISPLSATASLAALKRLHEKGIHVVVYNGAVKDPSVAASVESSQEDLGRQTGAAARRYIEEKLGGKAKVALLAFKSLLPEQSNGRSNGFRGEIAKLPGVEIVAEQDAWLAEAAIKRVGDILTAHPDVQVIWSANEGGTVGAAMAVKNSGRAGKVAVFGTDTSDQLADALLSDDGILQAVTGQQPFRIGAQAVETAVKAARGEPVEAYAALPGVLLSREDPAKVRSFKEDLKKLMAGP
jgi:sugar transport system substrate-binding protein